MKVGDIYHLEPSTFRVRRIDDGMVWLEYKRKTPINGILAGWAGRFMSPLTLLEAETMLQTAKKLPRLIGKKPLPEPQEWDTFPCGRVKDYASQTRCPEHHFHNVCCKENNQ